MADDLIDDPYVVATRAMWARHADVMSPETLESHARGYARLDDYRALIDAARRIGREEAAAAILAHADKHAPDRTDARPSAMRRHLHIAARVAVGPPSDADVIAALKSMGTAPFAVGCHLDEAGRAVDPDV